MATYLLRGLIKCGLCRLTFCGITLRHQHDWYYRCNGRHVARGLYGLSGKKCPSKALNGDYVERLVWADIEAFLRNPGDVLERLRDRLTLKDEERKQQEKELRSLKERLEQKTGERDRMLGLFIRWGCPVPSFGDLSISRVATMGLNPSNREFVDESGNELQGVARRFHTLNSLSLASWADADARHLKLILESCSEYFLGNPYDTWFKKLDLVVQGAEASFYDPVHSACHLDLIPYATSHKWTELTTAQRSALLEVAGDTLGLLLRDSPVRVLILNGQSVVDEFQEIAGISLEKQLVSDWTLRRSMGRDVYGYAYRGLVNTIAGVTLTHEVLVLGYNHNLQSSFGVTNGAIKAIRDWISRAVNEAPA